ncbi:MAG: hypothetical protein OXC28_24055 [Defluviicoccus sp.]|nr:hypothetical protein [Defluviicoccus sp.]
MTARDIGRAGVAAIALLAGALLLLPENAEASQCSRSERVNHRDAECLYAWWKNRGLLKKSPFHVRNQCSEYGKVVAKVDLASASDRTLHLIDDNPRDGDTRHRIRGISCCSDMGICNRSDAVTDEGCLERFRRVSPAIQNRNCRDYTATAEAGENLQCTVTAQCDVGVHPFIPMYKTTSVTVPFVDLDDVRDCGAVLTHGICRPSLLWIEAGDAETEEAEGATLDFRVTLSDPFPETVTVRYHTSDKSAIAGLDYARTAGVLAFAPGETAKTISVPVLNDDLDEWQETMKFWLSGPNVPEARILLDWPATGTIVNTDRIPKAWIARFGRTVADQVLDAVDARMQAAPTAGVEAYVAGQRIGLGPPLEAASGGDEAFGLADWPEGGGPALRDSGPLVHSRVHGQAATGHGLPPSASFSLTGEARGGGYVSIWGRGAVTRFSGSEGDLSVDGEVASGLLGADWTTGNWMTGLLVSHSSGDGGYGRAGGPGSGSGTGGALRATLTGVWPWVRHAPGERLSVWGVAGYGSGSLTLDAGDRNGARNPTIRTGLDLWMAAVGLRGIALDGGDDNLTLAVKTDAMVVRTGTDAVSGAGGNLAGAEADVTRIRLGLEASRPFRLADGSTLTPGAGIGLRRDSGDAETGFGAEIGAGIAWADPERGLGAALRGRGLLAHRAKGFRERGLSGSFAWDPVAGDRGPRLSLTQTLGVPAQGGADALLTRPTPAGPATGEPGDSLRGRRLEARFGYGFPAFGDRFTATPGIAIGLSDAGRDYSLGWRLTPGGVALDGRSLELAFEARRRESTSRRNAPPEHAAGFRVTSRF